MRLASSRIFLTVNCAPPPTVRDVDIMVVKMSILSFDNSPSPHLTSDDVGVVSVWIGLSQNWREAQLHWLFSKEGKLLLIDLNASFTQWCEEAMALTYLYCFVYMQECACDLCKIVQEIKEDNTFIIYCACFQLNVGAYFLIQCYFHQNKINITIWTSRLSYIEH